MNRNETHRQTSKQMMKYKMHNKMRSLGVLPLFSRGKDCLLFSGLPRNSIEPTTVLCAVPFFSDCRGMRRPSLVQYLFWLQGGTIKLTIAPRATPFLSSYTLLKHLNGDARMRFDTRATSVLMRSVEIPRWDSALLSTSWPFPFRGKGLSFYREYHPIKDGPRRRVCASFHRKHTQLRVSFDYSNSSRK